MRLFLIQHGLRDLHSHDFNEALGWRRACDARGIELRHFVHKDATRQVIGECGATPQFPYEPQTHIKRDPVSDVLEGFIKFSRIFAHACRTFSDIIDSGDVVYVANATVREIYGLALWLETVPENRRPQVVFNFLVPDLRWHLTADRENFTGDISLYRFAANALEEAAGRTRIHICAGTGRLRKILEMALQLPCTLSPVPISYEDETPNEDSTASWTPAHIAVMGQMRIEKGKSLVPEVFDVFRRNCPGHKIFIQTENQDQAKGLALRFGGAKDLSLGIAVGQIPPETYAQRLRSVEILLLPYSRTRYAMRSSGLFSEAMAYGVPVVVPNGTWMSDQLDDGWGAGVVFDRPDAASIAAALEQASRHVAPLTDKARKTMSKWRQAQCTAALADHVWNLVAGKTSEGGHA